MSRDREEELRTILRQAQLEPFGVALRGLLDIELERVKTNLLDAALEQDFRALQGEGRAFRKILKYLTAPVAHAPKV
jgi:hypothetical protein